MSNITLSDSCINCGNCVQVCPSFVYEEVENVTKPTGANRCILCGHCISSCPTDAIQIKEISENTEFSVAGGSADIENWLKSRRTIRNYTSETIHEETMNKILKWGESVPRAHNSDSFELLVIQDKALIKQIENALAEGLNDLMKALRDREQKQTLIEKFGEEKFNIWRRMLPELRFITGKINDGTLSLLHNAPALIIAACDKTQLQTDISAQLVLHHISLGAHFHGFGSCWLGFIMIVNEFSSKINELLGIENTLKIAGAMVLGSPKIPYKKGISRKIKTRFFN